MQNDVFSLVYSKYLELNVYPVYILKRVVDQLVDFCEENAPKESLGVLLGWHFTYPEYKDIVFTKITDWVTGEVDATHVGAQFTKKGVEEYNLLLDEKYGQDRPDGPFNVGLFHSHPFGKEPHFSSIDLNTFFSFPYNAEYNVFILIDPVPDTPYFKVFQLRKQQAEMKLFRVPWVEYSPVESDFSHYVTIKQENEEDPIFNPPEIKDLNEIDKKKKRII